MKGNDSEERTETATPKRLRDARKKGQVSNSRDMVLATTTSVALLYLWFGANWINEELQRLIALPGEIYDLPFEQAAGLLAAEALDTATEILVPLLVIVLLIAFTSSIAVLGGVVFSGEPIKPNLGRIDPISGFTKIFSLRNLIEMLKSLVKVTLMTALIAAVCLVGLDALVKIPLCGVSCASAVFDMLTKPVVAIATILLLFFGLLDIGIQRWLFLRDMRMTKTELKRERKDMEGDPQVRRARRREQRAIAAGAAVGVRHATLILTDGYGIAVGLRYVRDETPVPLLVCKGRKDKARDIVNAAQRQGTPLVANAGLAEKLSSSTPMGTAVPEAVFKEVGQALIKAGLV